MVTAEDVGSLIILIVALAYAQIQKKPCADKILSPSAEDEVNPVRWSHDGCQSASRKNGNQERIYDQHVVSMIPYL